MPRKRKWGIQVERRTVAEFTVMASTEAEAESLANEQLMDVDYDVRSEYEIISIEGEGA